jgi:hypothetical protein
VGPVPVGPVTVGPVTAGLTASVSQTSVGSGKYFRRKCEMKRTYFRIVLYNGGFVPVFVGRRI